MKSLPGYKPVASLRWTPDGKIQSVNRRACELFGYAEEEFLGRGILDFDPGMTEESREAYLKELRAEGAATFPRSLRRKDGRLFHAMVFARHMESDGCEFVDAFIDDITERKEAVEALRKSEYFLRKSQEVARMGSFTLEIPSRTWTASPMIREICGFPEGYPGTIESFLELVVPEQRKAVLGVLEREIVAGRNRDEMEFRILRRDNGEERWLYCRGEFKFDGQGSPVRMIGTAQDITELKRAEKEREELEERLRQSHKWETIGRLAGGVAHEYNNMLAVILGYADVMRSRIPANDPLRRFVDEIEKAGTRARDVTAQLLAFSRKQPIAPKVLDLNGYLGVKVKTLSRMIGEGIRMDFSPGEDLWDVLVDPSQLEQALVNLAVNARDAMPGGGRIRIKTANVSFEDTISMHGFAIPPGDYVRLTVTDNGIGMDRETFSHLFEPFFSTKGIGKGTGLGLPTVYGIVKRNGGFIEADSAPGRGATFRIFFPRLTEGAAAAEPPAEGEGTVPPMGRILLVEDDEMVRVMVLRMLEDLGYAVSCEESALNALALFRKPDFEVDLLVADVVMAGMSGPALWEKVKMLRPETKVLFISGYSAGEIAERGIRGQDERILAKPFSRSMFADAVRSAISRG